MAISDTITSMYENVGNVYDVLELAGADLTNVDKNIENLKQSWEERLLYFLANGTDVVWNNWLPKVTGSGETITLNNTIEAKMDFVYKGNTYQYSTSGKNIFALPDTQTLNSKVYTNNSNGTFNISGTASANTNIYKAVDLSDTNITNGETYTLSRKSGGYNIQIDFYQDNSYKSTPIYVYGNALKSTQTITIPNGANKVRFILYFASGNSTSLTNEWVQLEKGSSDTSFEPYTGGIPAPNPDYPQDIQVVSGDNTIKVEGKNLFDKDNANIVHKLATANLTFNTDSHFVSIYVPAEAGKTYTISSTSNLFDTFSSLYFTSEDLNIATTCLLRVIRNPNTASSITATAPTGTKYVCAYIMYSTNQNDINSLLSTIQIEASSTATTYEPYQSQSYPINLGDIELCKIGDYQDKIAKSTGRNLFDGVFRQGNRYTAGLSDTTRIFTTQNYYVESGKTYTISTTLNTSTYKYAINLAMVEYPIDENAQQYYDSGWKTSSSFTFTPSQDGYLGIVIAKSNGTDNLTPNNISSYQFMLNEGATALPYEPYGKVWYLNKQIGKVVLDGSETYGSFSNNRFRTPVITKAIDGFTTIISMCNMLVATTQSDMSSTTQNNLIAVNGDYIWLRITNSTTEQELKTLLQNTNAIVYYPLATPTTTEITDTTLISQLEAIKYSYDSQTNITQTNDDMPFILDVVALGELS